MTLRQLFGQTYRHLLRAVADAARCRLPVKYHGHWLWWPTKMWSGFVSRYEPYMDTTIQQILRPGMGFADIGAHHGVWAGLARKLVGSGGVVVACEPSPAYETLNQHLGRYRNVQVTRAALGSAEGETRFFAQGEGTSGSVRQSVTELNKQFSPGIEIEEITVPIQTLDHLLAARLDRQWLIKVDVEGYELEVLRGAKVLLASHKVSWVVELHPEQLVLSGGSEADVINLLTRGGYEVREVDRNANGIHTVVATKMSEPV